MSSIDWGLAAKVGRALVPSSPIASRSEIEQLVAELREGAGRAPTLIADVSELPDPGSSRVLVLDRPTAVEATVDTARAMLDRLDESTGSSLVGRIQGGVTGAGLGGVLAMLSTRILGQYDPFHVSPRLILVAPNVLQAERELNLPASDFRLWICLHEQTHRVQFEHAPWLTDHIIALAGKLMAAEEAGVDWTRIGGLRGNRPGPESVVQLLGDEAESSLNEITAVMSLIEGHADVMMDRVSRDVIATVPMIRNSFNKRRSKKFSKFGQLIGLETKLAQYKDGARFCEQVIAKAGVAQLNRAFEEPENLPTIEELHDPVAWLSRMSDGA